MARGVVVLVVAAVLLAGCGEEKKFTPANKGSDAAAKVLAAAPAKTRAERTARVAMSMKSSGRPVFHATGLTRLDVERARLRMTFDTSIESISAGTTMDFVTVDDDIYVRPQPNGPWLHSTSGGGADATFSTGFAESLDYLSAVTGNAKPAGEVTVRGNPARLYSATVDLDAVADNLPADERGAYRKKRAKTGLPARLPVKVAIDEQGRIARMDYAFTVSGQKISLAFDMFDFGAKGDLAVPKKFEESP